MFDFSESISFLPSPPLAMEEGCGSARCLPGNCQDHSFPSLPDRTYLRPLQQCMTTAKHPVGSHAGASPPTAYLTTLSALLSSQHHQKPSSSSSDAAGKMGNGRRKLGGCPWHPLGWSPGQRSPRCWDFGLWLPSEHIFAARPAHSPASPVADDKRRSLTFIFGDSRLLLLQLYIKGRLPPPWESS